MLPMKITPASVKKLKLPYISYPELFPTILNSNFAQIALLYQEACHHPVQEELVMLHTEGEYLLTGQQCRGHDWLAVLSEEVCL